MQEPTAYFQMVGRTGRVVERVAVLEYLIFAQNGNVVALDAFDGEAGARARCQYVVALTEELSSHASQMVNAWSPDGKLSEQLVQSGVVDSMWMNQREAW
ncbi:MAG: imelysin family protein [Polyangiales bacterium]